MNLYFLVEGRSTEKKVYPKLIDYFLQKHFSKVSEFDQVQDNNYYLLSGNGYPRIFSDVLKNTIQDINTVDNYDYLVLCIDADETTIEEREAELNRYLKKFKEEDGIELNEGCEIKLIVQNKCFESWFLGNKKIYKTNPSDATLLEYQQFYNVRENDPELMNAIQENITCASFHYSYLKKSLSERNIRYTKNSPNEVGEPYYLKELVDRTKTTDHLNSFRDFIEFCNKINREVNAA